MNREDLHLNMAVSDVILFLVDQALNGELSELPRGDVQGLTEAAAVRIVKMVHDNDRAEL
jgi:hypothetical protein